MKKKSLFTLFYQSFYSFKDIAKFRFLSIGKTIQYVFLLVLFYFLPAMMKLLFIERDFSHLTPHFDRGSLVIIIPLYLIFTFILYTGILFIKISFLAGVAGILAKGLKRSLPYRNGWRLTAFCITLPTVLFGLLPLFGITIAFGTLYDLAISAIYIFATILKLPRPKKHS
ncbi:DUF1189 domain-containing protein [Lederbergia sp. NSJ-179]|uniref:DUF1189 family protein n=1 Tax=Lederbergia sp. NSJ-179 TaxID=2931402 RepID=UPI001FD61B2D|nr:DUF1189 family protein [Lederbergia sp. NSJ-179]MCJ7843420.1 DUF1189 domain-containing protein [Lederbergia sp. NSJ-179]